ncbi:MAG: heme-binding domain-containing protein [Anaerolineae bacterium]|nr:heme-binding domain-containing protein [Anaerolineae bacterium]
MKFRNIVFAVIGIIVVGLILIQFVPGYARTNPPVTYQMQWSSPETEQLMRQACYDCHSNETRWPWYASIAPVSWLVVRDVNEGRDALNFSTGRGELEAEDLINELREGEMPPSIYLITHGDANLNADQKTTLIAGIQTSSFTGAGGESDEDNETGEGDS